MSGQADADPRSDQQLVAAINQGDQEAFDALYVRYRDWVVRLAFRFTGDRDEALDVLQETFSYLLRKFPGFRLSARMTTFLYPVVRHTAIRLRRKRGRNVSDDTLLQAVEAAPTSERDHRADLAVVVNNLPLEQREVILLRFVDGLALDEIAEALAIPPGTVKSRLHRALTALKEDPKVRRYFDH